MATNSVQVRSSNAVAYVCNQDYILQSDKFLPTTNRNVMVHSLIKACGLLEQMAVVYPKKATVADLELFHSSDYVEYLKKNEQSMNEDEDDGATFGFGYDCPIKNGMFTYCQTIAGGSITAAELLCQGHFNVAIHWLGGWHHAKRSEASGYCYVNDCVLAILRLKQNFSKVLYVDLDLHHGDGVQEAFSATNKVMTFSVHKFEAGFFPGSGDLHDVGFGKGRYHSVNLPFKDGCNDKTFMLACKKVLSKINSTYKPNAVVCQVGADGLNGDPMRSFNLTTLSLTSCVDSIVEWQLPTLILGGGGYNEANVARCWCQITGSIVKASLPEEIPDHEGFPNYGPDFEFEICKSLKKDFNCSEHVDTVLQTIFKNLDNI